MNSRKYIKIGKRLKINIFTITPFVPLLFLIPALIALFTNNLTIYPGMHSTVLIPYSDSTSSEYNDGNSYVKSFTNSENGIDFTFHLVEGYEYPYAGFKIKCSPDSGFTDVTKYDNIIMSISSINSKAIRIILRTFVDSTTILTDESTYRPNVRELHLLPGTNQYSIPLKSFITDSWWYHELNVTESNVGDANFSKVLDIEIETGDVTPQNSDQNAIIHSIQFQKDNRTLTIVTLLAILFYYLIYSFLIMILKKTNTPIAIPYEKLNLINYNDEYLSKIVDYIAKEYTNQMLTIGRIGDEIGINPTKIAQVIQLSFNLTFKQYLNTIRLAEAKRLFRETDRNVSEIAISVGYRNITHFYRAFKLVFNITPKEYRNNFKKSPK